MKNEALIAAQKAFDIEAEDANDAIQKLINDGILDSRYEFLELKKYIDRTM